MNNKILIYAVIFLAVILIVAAIGVEIYSAKKNRLSGDNLFVENQPKTNQSESGENDLFDNESEREAKELTGDNFSISLPLGWEGVSAPDGVLAIAMRADEEINDPATHAINFKSYLAINYKMLGDRDKEEYIQYTKDYLTEMFPEISFPQEKRMTANG